MEITLNPISDLKDLKPGFYKINDDLYRSLDAISNSDITDKIRYPHGFLKVADETDAMRFGTAFHCYCLEPALFNQSYAVINMDKRTKEYREAVEMCDAKILDKKEFQAIQQMTDLLASTKWGEEILKSPYKELVGIFSMGGKKFKFKADCITEVGGYPYIFDLKTTKSIAPSDIIHSVSTYGYARQAAFYLIGMKELLQNACGFCGVFVEKPESKIKIGIDFVEYSDQMISDATDLINKAIASWNENPPIREINIFRGEQINEI